MNPSSSYPLTILICAHNSDPALFNPMLDALQRMLAFTRQTLPDFNGQLFIVDNASEPPLAQRTDLNLPAEATIVSEPQLGILFARARAQTLGTSEWLLFLDDDTLPAEDYIIQGFKLIAEHPQMGCFSGRIDALYHTPPEPWALPFTKYLAILPAEKLVINTSKQLENMGDRVPVTGGMFVRRELTQYHSRLITTDPRRLNLGRRGKSLLGGEDTDMALCTHDIGYLSGINPAMRITHIIPARRLQADYLARLVGSTSESTVLVKYLHNSSTAKPNWIRYLYKALQSKSKEERKIRIAALRGTARGLKRARQMMHEEPQGQPPRNVFILTKAITPECIAKRDNAEFAAMPSLKKPMLLAKRLHALYGCRVTLLSYSYSAKKHRSFSEQPEPWLTIRHGHSHGLVGNKILAAKWSMAHWAWLKLQQSALPGDWAVAYNPHFQYVRPMLKAARKLGTRSILDYEDGLHLKKRYRNAYYRHQDKVLGKALDGCLCVSEALQQRILSLQTKGFPTLLCHGHIDAEALGRSPQRTLGKSLRLGYAGAFGKDWGLAELLAYIEHLPPHCSLDIMGKAEPEAVDAVQRAIGKRSNIRLRGVLMAEQYEEALNGLDAMIMLNYHGLSVGTTNFPMKLFDYLSHNLPVITTANPQYAPYQSLPHLHVIDDIAKDFANTLHALEGRHFDKAPILSLYQSEQEKLASFAQQIHQADCKK